MKNRLHIFLQMFDTQRTAQGSKVQRSKGDKGDGLIKVRIKMWVGKCQIDSVALQSDEMGSDRQGGNRVR